MKDEESVDDGDGDDDDTGSGGDADKTNGAVNEDNGDSFEGSEVDPETSAKPLNGISEYERSKQKNIEELRDILVSMDLLHPMSYFKNREAAEITSTKKDEGTGKGKGKAAKEGERREIRSA